MSRFGDLMQNFIMSNPKRANWFLSHMSASFWERKGKQKAFENFKKASLLVPAYRHFLEQKGIDLPKIERLEDFQKLPLMNKQTYLVENQEKLENLCLNGELSVSHTIARSSGYTGNPLYWPRIARQDEMATKSAVLFYTNFWEGDKKPTLIIITFDLGTWIAGEMSADCCRDIAKNYPLSVITPGSRLEETLEIIERLGPKFEQIAIFGYPPFLKKLLDKGEERRISWQALNIVLLPAGESFSEKWRSYILSRIGKKESLTAIIGLFGSSEGAIVGYETPLSNLVRQLVEQSEKICKDLFGIKSPPCSLVQYNPIGIFIEEVKSEIVVTTGGALPLIRYSIDERGGVLPFEHLMTTLLNNGYNIVELLEERGITRELIWRLPFFYTFGRDNSISIEGANIYVENIEPALLKPGMDKVNNWKLAVEEDKDHNLQLCILIELENRTHLSQPRKKLQNLKKQYHKVFLNQLLESNPDFKSAYRNNPEACDPLVEIYSFGQGPFAGEEERIKQKHIL